MMEEFIKEMQKEELDQARELKEQYEKEYQDALNLTGLCVGMKRTEANRIARDLLDHIHSLSCTIERLENMV